MNFERIVAAWEVSPLLRVLDAHPAWWHDITIRQDYLGSAHHDTECIFVLGPRSFTPEHVFEDLSAVGFPPLAALRPALLAVVQPLLSGLQVTTLGRVLIVRLGPGGVIDEHTDEGRYAQHFARFHLVLTSNPHCELVVAGQAQPMAPGELWWFNHRLPHAGANRGDTPRIHLIFDAVTPRFRYDTHQDAGPA